MASTGEETSRAGWLGRGMRIWDCFAGYSPFAFRSPIAERLYQDFRAGAVELNARCLLTMTALFWVVGIFQGVSTTPLRPLALAAACSSLAATAATLMVQLDGPHRRALYLRNWPAFHLAVHLAHVPTYFTLRTVLIELYSPIGGMPCRTFAQCTQEFLLIFPHFATGLFACWGLALPLLPQLVTQAAVLSASHPGNVWVCTASHNLTALVPGPGKPTGFAVFPVPGTTGSHLQSHADAPTFCSLHLALWEIQAAALAVLLTLWQEWRGRRQFLAAHPDADEARAGDAQALMLVTKKPFACVHSPSYCLGLVFWVLLLDCLLVDLAMLWAAGQGPPVSRLVGLLRLGTCNEASCL